MQSVSKHWCPFKNKHITAWQAFLIKEKNIFRPIKLTTNKNIDANNSNNIYILFFVTITLKIYKYKVNNTTFAEKFYKILKPRSVSYLWDLLFKTVLLTNKSFKSF